MIPSKPKVSVITVCYNAERTIAETLQSVRTQTYANIEHIIIDGASTDGTLEIIDKHRGRISKVISEKDSGIFDAMNKGIRITTGEILYFLNADDVFFDKNTVSDFVREFDLKSSAEIIYGKAEYLNMPKRISLSFEKENFEYKARMDLFTRLIPQQCFFIHKKAFDTVGLFNISYKIYGDYDWFLRAMNKKIKTEFYDRYAVNYNLQGRSYVKRYAAIGERIEVIWRSSTINEFIVYLIYASYRKLVHIFLEEITTPLLQLKNNLKGYQKNEPA